MIHTPTLSFLLFAVLFIVTIGTFAAFSYTFVRYRSVEMVPSVGWLCLINAPYLLSWTFFPDPYRSLHASGMMLITLALCLSDYASFRYRSPFNWDQDSARVKDLFIDAASWILTTITLVVFLYHLASVESIPLLESLLSKTSGEENSQLRNEFNRMLPVPFWLRYVISFNIYVFGLPAVVLHWAQKRRAFSIALSLTILAYSTFSTARLPAVFFAGAIVLQIFSRLVRRYRILPKILLVFLLLGISGVGGYSFYTVNKLREEFPDRIRHEDRDPRNFYAPSDYFRVEGYYHYSMDFSFLRGRLDYLVYRTFLTPVDVADRWYQYFTYVRQEPLPVSNMIRRAVGTKEEHPAVQVARWAFGRFGYPSHSHANASVDADAYAYGGMFGVLVAALLLGCVRFSLAFFHTRDPIGETLYVVALAQMLFIPSSGSLPALLIPNGLIIVIGMMAAIWLWTRFSRPAPGQLSQTTRP